MSQHVSHKVCVSTREYTDNQTGDRKKAWHEVGIALSDATGRITSVKLEVMPLPKAGRDGYPEIWLNLFPLDRQESMPPAAQTAQSAPVGAGDDVPF